MSIDTDINKLTKRYKGASPDAVKQISEWRERFNTLSIRKEWFDHPETIAFRTMALEQVERINSILTTSRDLSQEARQDLFAEKEAHMLYLSMLTNDAEGQLESLGNQVSEELKS